ncbi:MAG: PH domain-containing protein [Chloroflexi bacterium]|nr:PH domain-containing protein [Chloroflexota bacterium]
MECYASKRKGIGWVLFWLLFAVPSVFAAQSSDIVLRVLGILLAVIFTGMLVIQVRRLFDSGPQLVISDAGIDYRRSWIGEGIIPWDDIRDLYLWQSQRNVFIGIELEDREKYLSRLSTYKQKMFLANAKAGYPDVAISFQDLTPSLNEVFEYLSTHYGEKLTQPNSV